MAPTVLTELGYMLDMILAIGLMVCISIGVFLRLFVLRRSYRHGNSDSDAALPWFGAAMGLALLWLLLPFLR